MSAPQRESARADVRGSREGRDRTLSARDLSLIAVFTAFIVVLGLPGALFTGSGVPITLQSLGIMLAGSLLGWRRGALATLAFVALVAVGLPVLAGGRGGLGIFAGPTVGYLISYPIASGIIGYLLERARRLNGITVFAATVLGGIVVIHAFGIVGMMWRAHLSLQAAIVADAVFIPGDLIKAAIATVVSLAVYRAMPDLLPRRSRA